MFWGPLTREAAASTTAMFSINSKGTQDCCVKKRWPPDLFRSLRSVDGPIPESRCSVWNGYTFTSFHLNLIVISFTWKKPVHHCKLNWTIFLQQNWSCTCARGDAEVAFFDWVPVHIIVAIVLCKCSRWFGTPAHHSLVVCATQIALSLGR